MLCSRQNMNDGQTSKGVGDVADALFEIKHVKLGISRERGLCIRIKSVAGAFHSRPKGTNGRGATFVGGS